MVELLFAVVIGLLLVGGSGATLRTQARAATDAAQTGERMDAARLIRSVVGSELRAGRRGMDWSVPGPDSLRLRAFRGIAIPCGPSGMQEVRVRFRGSRAPEPEKDSVLVLRADGSWRALDLVQSSPVAEPDPSSEELCLQGSWAGEMQRWTVGEAALDPEGLGPVVIRLFERGSYHLANASFRYRSGAGGRQPLVPELLEDDSGWDTAASGAALRLRVKFFQASEGSSTWVRSFTLWFHHP